MGKWWTPVLKPGSFDGCTASPRLGDVGGREHDETGARACPGGVGAHSHLLPFACDFTLRLCATKVIISLRIKSGNQPMAVIQEKRSIVLKTLAFAEAFGFAFTAFETWRWMLAEDENECAQAAGVSLLETLQALDALKKQGSLVEKYGYYTFSDQEELIEERLRRLTTAAWKLKRARRWARVLVRLPYVRAVYAYGSLATQHTKEKSDLDVLVVTKSGKIFTARAMVTLFTEALGIRRTNTKIQDQVCLNHYVVEDALAFPYPSAFTAWLWSRMFPLAVRDEGLAQAFMQANKWVGRYFPNLDRNWKLEIGNLDEQQKTEEQNRFSRGVVERWARRYQLGRIARNPLTYKPGGRVVANDQMMIFHPKLPEEKVLAAYRKRMERLSRTG